MSPTMSNAEFKDRIRAICGPAPKAERPCVRTPEDRGYYPPSSEEQLAISNKILNWWLKSARRRLPTPPKEAV
jgi:hypothetical protein